MFKKLIIFPLIFTLIYSCSKNVSPVDSALETGIFHFGNGSEPQGIDPHVVTGVPEHHILISLCEGLTIANPYGEGNLPGVAESWTISDDGKEYIFNLSEFDFDFPVVETHPVGSSKNKITFQFVNFNEDQSKQ